MGTLGDKLKEARENLGLSLREVEEATKIRKKYLQALENEEFDVIPGKTYAKGFLKIYAKFLNLDYKEILEEFESIFTPPAEENELSQPLQAEQIFLRKNNLFKFIAVAVGIIVLFFAISLFLNNIWGDSNVPDSNRNININENIAQEKEVKESNEDISSEEADNKKIQEQKEGVEIEIEIIDQECWVKIENSDETIFQGIMKEGEKKIFTDDSELTITLGNAGAARVIYNGTELPPLGEPGQVVTRTFEDEQ